MPTSHRPTSHLSWQTCSCSRSQIGPCPPGGSCSRVFHSGTSRCNAAHLQKWEGLLCKILLGSHVVSFASDEICVVFICYSSNLASVKVLYHKGVFVSYKAHAYSGWSPDPFMGAMPKIDYVMKGSSVQRPRRKGVNLFVGRTYSGLCPVVAMLEYLEKRGTTPGPLFHFRDGHYLTRPRFVELLRAGLREAGIDEAKYCSHSFCIGATTTATARGIEDSFIKTIGCWESLAYLQYVRIPRSQLTNYARLLAAE